VCAETRFRHRALLVAYYLARALFATKLLQIPRNPPPGLQHTEEWHPELVDFVAECLVKDLEQRPFARELLEHPLTKRGAVTTSQVCLFGSDFAYSYALFSLCFCFLLFNLRSGPKCTSCFWLSSTPKAKRRKLL
jgi:hypothetical protein